MDDYQSVQQVISEMYRHLIWQSQKLQTLEAELNKLSTRLDTIAAEPGMKVDRMEYKFDQLKIETLNGNLMIGMPNDKLSVEDMGIQNLFQQGQATEQGEELDVARIQTEIHRYIHEDIPKLLADVARAQGTTLLPEQVEAVMADMERQMVARITAYSQRGDIVQAGKMRNEYVIRRLKEELLLSVERYVAYFHQWGDDNGRSHPANNDE